jgi:hypothetical protein
MQYLDHASSCDAKSSVEQGGLATQGGWSYPRHFLRRRFLAFLGEAVRAATVF